MWTKYCNLFSCKGGRRGDGTHDTGKKQLFFIARAVVVALQRGEMKQVGIVRLYV